MCCRLAHPLSTIQQNAQEALLAVAQAAGQQLASLQGADVNLSAAACLAPSGPAEQQKCLPAPAAVLLWQRLVATAGSASGSAEACLHRVLQQLIAAAPSR